jgi:DNA polymerase-1
MVALGIENPNDPKQILQALEDAGCEFDPRFANEKGRPSTTKVALGEYAEHQPHLQPLTTAIVTYGVAKQRSNHLRSIDEAIDLGRVHPTIDPHSSESGRMSMSDPALMNLRRELRGVLTAEPGHVLVPADFDTVEWRVAAALSGDKELTARIKAGTDLHAALATKLFGPDYTEGDRELAKTISFQVLYGAGPNGIAKDTGLNRREAERLLDDIWDAYKQLKRYDRRVRAQRSMLTPYGRTIPAADEPFKNLNMVVQATARDLLVHALCRLADLGWADNVWMLLHDEIILQVPEKDAGDAVEALNEAMNLDLLGVPISAIGEVLGRQWR